jgi:hypothetical protein
MKTRFSLALALSLMSLSAGAGPVLMAEKAQAQNLPGQVSSESQDAIEQVTGFTFCWRIPGIGVKCYGAR